MSTTTVMDAAREYERWCRLLCKEQLPAAVVDLDALDANIDTLVGALGKSSITLRVASKSVRHVWLLRHILKQGGERVRGLMTYSAAEAVMLAKEGFDDFLMAYPVAGRGDARLLAELVAGGRRLVAMVDCRDQLALLDDAAREAAVQLSVCIDVDVSWRPLGGLLHFGVRRSPIREGRDAVALAAYLRRFPNLQLTAVMAYEAQVAGVADRNPDSRYLDALRHLIKARSRPLVLARRGEIAAALTDAGHRLTLVNGGGTGSIGFTAADPSVTEVTAGSGFLCPHLFDHYHDLALRPAAFFALPVVRRSDSDHVTCGYGGYVASGPPASDRAPSVYLPKGLKPIALEGWGEVQTPLKVEADRPLPRLADPVICRHAKAGELAERFNSYLLVRGDRIVAREPTYRGMGHAFG